MVKLLIYSLLISICIAVNTVCSYAQSGTESAGFFPKGGAIDPLEESILEQNEAPEIQHLKPTPEPEIRYHKTKQEEKNGAVKLPVGKDGKEVKLDTAVRERDGKDPVADELVSQFGDPTAESTIKAQDNAPTPFKGMMAALDKGRDDIAMMYAVQYVRHFRKLKDATGKVMEMVPMAARLEDEEEELKVEPNVHNDIGNSQPEVAKSPEAIKKQENQEVEKLAGAMIEKLRLERENQHKDSEAFGFGGSTGGYGGGR